MAAILIVDDEFDLADLLGELLALRGHAVAVTINGVQGLAHLGNHRVDLVISDIMMPVMGGRELVAAMSATETLASIPVILMSAVPELMTPLARQGQVRTTLVKPFAPAHLYAAVDAALA